VIRSPKTLLTLFLGLISISSYAQMPDKFTNLQFFPKDIAKDDLMQSMRGFSFALGVRCEHCHEGGGELNKMNFAADSKEEKRTARVMLKMVADINRDYLGKIGKTSPLQVQCVTCHHGLARPQTIDSVFTADLEKKDLVSAISEYKDLRQKYYGTARYDFGETPLNVLTEKLLKQDKNKEAVAVMDLNAEFNSPLSVWGSNLQIMSDLANQNTAKAKDDLRKTVAAHPDDKWAVGKIEELEGKQK
jgi:hypothetical protein